METNRYLDESDLLFRLAQESKLLAKAAAKRRHIVSMRWFYPIGEIAAAQARLKEAAAGVLVCLEALGLDPDSEELRTLRMKRIVFWIRTLEALGAQERIDTSCVDDKSKTASYTEG